MDLSYKQEISVGGLVILAIVLFFVGTTWLSGRSFGRGGDEYWRIQFRDVGNLKVSSVVKVSGVPVGQVEDISLADVGKVIVAVSLDERIVPRTDATAEIAAVGFVGDVVVDFRPGEAPQPLSRDRVIVGRQARGLTDLAERLGGRTDSLLVGAQALVNQRTADELHATMKAFQGTLKAAQQVMELYANPRQGPAAALVETMTSLRQVSARLDSTLANPALVRTLSRTDTLSGNLSTMTAQFASTGARLDTLLGAMNRGRGTLGKFATDSALYYGLVDVTRSLKELLDDLRKHPGKISPTVKFCC